MSTARVRVLDVSALDPPEPLMRVLAELESLQPHEYLRMHHRMRPVHLYPHLEQRGFAHDTRSTAEGMCEIFIWRRDDPSAASAARQSAARLPLWPAD